MRHGLGRNGGDRKVDFDRAGAVGGEVGDCDAEGGLADGRSRGRRTGIPWAMVQAYCLPFMLSWMVRSR
jgi:hypothetical protein